MNDTTELERGYRRLVACYPRTFRRENEEEIVGVLLATAPDGQRRPGIAESADLIRGAVRMRMGLSRSPRTVLNAVRLMYAGAAAQLAALVTFALTAASARADFILKNPHATAAQLQQVNAHIVGDWIALPIAIGFWLWMAWANGRGYDWARLVCIGCFALNTITLLAALGTGVARYAPAATIACAVTWAIGFAALALIFCKPSWGYYTRQAAAGQ